MKCEWQANTVSCSITIRPHVWYHLLTSLRASSRSLLDIYTHTYSFVTFLFSFDTISYFHLLHHMHNVLQKMQYIFYRVSCSCYHLSLKKNSCTMYLNPNKNEKASKLKVNKNKDIKLKHNYN